MSKDKDAEIKTIYDDLSVDELKEALKNIFFYAGEFTDADMEEMNKIMTVLERKEPSSPMYSAEESWECFKETYSDELSVLGVHNTEEVMQGKASAGSETVVSISETSTVRPVRRRKLLRIGLVAAIMVVIILAATVTASAFGYNLFGWVPKWNDSTFHYVHEDKSTAVSLDIPTALKQLGIEEPLFPSWLPDGFILAEQQLHLEAPVVLYSAYLKQDRVIMINIRSEEGSIPYLATEKDGDDPIEYEYNNRMHFIFNNLEQTTATWDSQGFIVYISGDLSIEEMESIIRSVYY